MKSWIAIGCAVLVALAVAAGLGSGRSSSDGASIKTVTAEVRSLDVRRAYLAKSYRRLRFIANRHCWEVYIQREAKKSMARGGPPPIDNMVDQIWREYQWLATDYNRRAASVGATGSLPKRAPTLRQMKRTAC